MSYRLVYPNGVAQVDGYNVNPPVMSAGYPNIYNDYRSSFSPESFSSDSGSSDSYEYRGRMITRETKCPQDVVRAPTPPPIIKRVVERAPTPETPVMERVIIRPKAQEIVERVIEQPRTPPPRLIQKEMHEDAPPPIVRTRVIKVNRPFDSDYNQSSSPYGNPCNGLLSLSNGTIGANNGYQAQSTLRSIGQPVAFSNALENSRPSFSPSSNFEYLPSDPMATAAPPSTMMMMMPSSQQAQPIGIMQPSELQQQQQQPVQRQIMYRPFQIQSSIPPLSSSYIPQNYTYPVAHPGISFGYRPMIQQGPMIPRGMPMMAGTNMPGVLTNSFPSQPPFFNPMAQQLVY